MDINQARADILNWIETFVERPNAALAGWPPCPYARRARIDGLLDIRVGSLEPYCDLRTIDMGNYEVIALVYDPKTFDAEEFDHQVIAANLAFLAGKDMIALADHPGSVEQVNGVCMNQGNWAIVFVQNLTKLDSAARDLAKKGFYKGWPEHYLKVLFNGRRDPRT